MRRIKLCVGRVKSFAAKSASRVAKNAFLLALSFLCLFARYGHCCEYKCVGSKDSCHALPGGKVESSAGGHAYEDTDGALGRKALAATAVLAGLAF